MASHESHASPMSQGLAGLLAVRRWHRRTRKIPLWYSQLAQTIEQKMPAQAQAAAIPAFVVVDILDYETQVPDRARYRPQPGQGRLDFDLLLRRRQAQRLKTEPPPLGACPRISDAATQK